MLQALYSGETGELELSGTRRGLLALGPLLLGKAGSCDLSENRRPFPHERSLSGIAFREDPERDTASIVTQDQILRIQKSEYDVRRLSRRSPVGDPFHDDHCCQTPQRFHRKQIRWNRWGTGGVLHGPSSGVVFRGDVDSQASDYFERVRVEVEPKVVSGSFSIIHVGRKKSPLAHFVKTRKALRGSDSRLAAPLQGPQPPATDAHEPRCWNGIERDFEMRSSKQCIFGQHAGLGVGLECG